MVNNIHKHVISREVKRAVGNDAVDMKEIDPAPSKDRPDSFKPLNVNKLGFQHLRGDPTKLHVSMNTSPVKDRKNEPHGWGK